MVTNASGTSQGFEHTLRLMVISLAVTDVPRHDTRPDAMNERVAPNNPPFIASNWFCTHTLGRGTQARLVAKSSAIAPRMKATHSGRPYSSSETPA